MFLTSSILLGFIRLSFIILFLLYLNRKFINVSNSINLLDFIIHNWFLYGSILLVIIFILVQLNAYNLFNCFFNTLVVLVIKQTHIDKHDKSHTRPAPKPIKTALRSQWLEACGLLPQIRHQPQLPVPNFERRVSFRGESCTKHGRKA